MTLPLYQFDSARQPRREADGHAGLWYDKFCNEWRTEGSTWILNDRKDTWIKSLTKKPVGCSAQIEESALRLAAMVDANSGRWDVFTADSRFVTGLGRSHPVENGFAWHSTLGTPSLPGSSVKGLVRAWTKLDADPIPDREIVARLLGAPGRVGSMFFLDAIPTTPVLLEADVMTPHYAGWSEDNAPGDWLSPTPIPFLVTARETSFVFGIVPRTTVSADDLAAVHQWLCSALAYSGAGAKTAVGYGRFRPDADKTENLKSRLRARARARSERMQAAREAEARKLRLETLSPVEREIEKILDSRQDRSTSDTIAIIQQVRSGRWTGNAKIEVAAWLQRRMQRERDWKEQSGARNPGKDKPFRRTLLIKRWLGGE